MQAMQMHRSCSMRRQHQQQQKQVARQQARNCQLSGSAGSISTASSSMKVCRLGLQLRMVQANMATSAAPCTWHSQQWQQQRRMCRSRVRSMGGVPCSLGCAVWQSQLLKCRRQQQQQQQQMQTAMLVCMR
jgi:hypothetical protein